MLRLPNDCVVLDGVTCRANLSQRERLFCPRNITYIGEKSGLRGQLILETSCIHKAQQEKKSHDCRTHLLIGLML